MDKNKLRQILAANLSRAMQNAPGADTQQGLAKKAGIGQSHVSRILRGRTAATVDMLAALAEALRVDAWELLTDSEATKKAVLQRLLWGDRAANERVEETYGRPLKEVATKRRKKDRGGEPAQE